MEQETKLLKTRELIEGAKSEVLVFTTSFILPILFSNNLNFLI